MRPLQQAFVAGALPLEHYPAGSWGPQGADRLIGSVERHWRISE
ncbi:MAG: hypothetical protein ABSC73_07380 [Acidimicrobiales bacterium]